MGIDAGTAWQRENRKIFDNIVENYDKVRWDYPDELFADIIRYSGTCNDKKALEIGAGTGKATTPFLDAGYAVTAVEMGANMTEFLNAKFKDRISFSVINSTFEDAVLEDNSYDLIYAASAFHWVDPEIGCPKVLRLLKSGGVFALFRNNSIPDESDDLYEEIQAVYDLHYYSHYKPNNRPVKLADMSREDFLKPEEIFRGFRFESLEQYGFVDIVMKLYDAFRTYDTENYIKLIDTYNDHRALPDENREALYAGLRKVIEKHGGQLKLNFVYQLYMGRKENY